MAATKQEVEAWKTHGKEKGYKFLVSVCDTFDHDDYPVYCKDDKELEEAKGKYDNKNMQRINEVITLVDLWYWFSFSFGGKNQGCCNVQAAGSEEAKQKVEDLGIMPQNDHIRAFEMDEPELDPDRLYSVDELKALEFKREKSTIKLG